MLVGLFLQEKKPPSVYVGTLFADAQGGGGFGYNSFNSGSLNPSVFEGHSITVLRWNPILGSNEITFWTAPATITKIKVDATEYTLTYVDGLTYRFNGSTPVFSNGNTYSIELIR